MMSQEVATMADSSIKQQIVAKVQLLSTDQQRRVLDFARTLGAPLPKGVPGKELLRFAGAIPKDDLKMMAEAIDEGCETVDAHDW